MIAWEWLIPVLLLGLAGGFLLGWGGGQVGRESRKADRELRDTRDELARYRDRVVAHFASTADLVNALSANHAALHRQLMQDAQELCSGREPSIKAITVSEAGQDESAPATPAQRTLVLSQLPLPEEKLVSSRLAPATHTKGWYRESSSEDEASDYVKEDPRY
ncbi:MAG: DUF1043 family protein [Gammaproteobacteria bacterium]|nr:DUF1043 family protein [Gammaproteobacteria bacterium]